MNKSLEKKLGYKIDFILSSLNMEHIARPIVTYLTVHLKKEKSVICPTSNNVSMH